MFFELLCLWHYLLPSFRIRILISAEASPLELFENILTQQEAREKPHLLDRPDIIVDDNLGFAKVSE